MIETIIEKARLARARIHASTWSLRGARVGTKVNIGRQCRVDHPQGVTLDHRVTLEDDVWLKLVSSEATVSVGAFSFLGRGSELDVATRVRIGSGVLIAPRVFIVDHTHNAERGTPILEQGCTGDPVDIGDDVWIGTGVTVLPGVTIGSGSIIGAGAVVRIDVPENEIWAGVPAKRIRKR